VLWADGKKSWLKEENLPQTLQECIKKGINYKLEITPLNEFGQKRMEFQQPQVPKPEGQQNSIAVVKR
jgi:hypothetical protein